MAVPDGGLSVIRSAPWVDTSGKCVSAHSKYLIALFGSYVRGGQEKDSDVDILVEVDPSIGLEFVTLAEEIEKLLGLPVDLVSRRAVSPRYWKVIEQELVYV